MEKWRRNAWKFGTIVFVFALIGVATAILLYFRAPVLTIEGLDFYRQDLEPYLSEQRSAVAAHYYQAYGVETMDEKFWEMEFDGTTPNEYLRQCVLENCIQDAMILSEAKKNGLIDKTDFPTLRREWESFNAQRTSDNQDGRTVYGPVSYSFTNYFRHLVSNLRNAILEQRLARDPIPEETLLEYYRANRSLFAIPGTVEAMSLTVTREEGTETALEQAERARSQIAEGLSFEEACARFAPSGEVRELSFTYLTQKADLHGNSAIYVAAAEMREGEVSEVLETPEGYCLVQTTKREEEQYFDYAEVKNRVRDALNEEWFNRYFEEKCANSSLKIDHGKWENIKIS